MEWFSSRYKHNIIPQLQIDNLNEETKIAIWNLISQEIIRNRIAGLSEFKVNELCRNMWTSCLAMPYDTYAEHYDISYLSKRSAEKFTKVVLKKQFYVLLDCIEFIIDYISLDIDKERNRNELERKRYFEQKNKKENNDFDFLYYPYFYDKTSDLNYRENELETYIHLINDLFEKYLVGYRVVEKKISKLTDQNEIREVLQALNSPVIEASTHINKAHNLLSNPRYYDYENSIKEAICAVETMARFITGIESATLSECIKKLDKIYPLHPALKESILKLYGYCSDCAGIRHGSKPGSNEYIPTAYDAKFILVMCSSLNNYLLQFKIIK